MFLYNVAFSLELLVIGLGAWLIGWAVFKAKCAAPSPVMGAVPGAKTCSTGHCGLGFVKGVGIILIILGVLNLLDTVYCTVKYKHRWNKMHEKIDMMYGNSSSPNNSNPVQSPSQPDNTSE